MHHTQLFITSLLTLLTLPLSASSQTVYLIRHGEKPANGDNGLSALGLQRAQCLRNVFGNESIYDIKYIMAMTPQKNGDRTRPLETVQPLATDLGITVDISCDRDDTDCVANTINGYEGEGNILISWQHGALTDIAKALGDENAPKWKKHSYDTIWTLPEPYTDITEMTSENCPGLDDN
ncbi:hypothetical protein BCIN_06g00500 [Botrytis cinerea B05.10]|uniref:Phosphoglycerate mutase family protein n=1 Tax=Botryotinia fuckeliana (strain B05.10) TaxID=332648 RepID=A0A384JJ21_BOTFB|nr:hypothetical protein BCIN_06g00500 [Botrytis cinerea B05.10]ATZ50553.1 hypothetical protein BCIN_06g00500 [Botrytis cinerea B05.10]